MTNRQIALPLRLQMYLPSESVCHEGPLGAMGSNN